MPQRSLHHSTLSRALQCGLATCCGCFITGPSAPSCVIFLHIHINTCTHTYAHKHAHAHISCTYANIHMHACTHVYMHTPTTAHNMLYVCTACILYIYICWCVQMHICNAHMEVTYTEESDYKQLPMYHK